MAAPTRYPSGTTILSVGTKRGLFLLASRTRDTWEVIPTSLSGNRIFSATLDQRHGKQRLYAADNGDFFGTFLRYSDDLGQTWQEPERGIQFPEGSGEKLTNIWTIEPGRAEEPDVVYAGVDPASLWISEDSGRTWTFRNAGLPREDAWSLAFDPDHKGRIYASIHEEALYVSDDLGRTWRMDGLPGTTIYRIQFVPDQERQ